MLTDILNIANRYARGLEHVQTRKEAWSKKHPELQVHLKAIAEYLNTNAAYKPGFFVDVLHAFNEEINGTCPDMQSLVFRSGNMSMEISFCNEKNEKKELVENGFEIIFNPTVTGEIIVFLLPHDSELSKTKAALTSLAIFTEPADITLEEIDFLLCKAMALAHTSSFTGIAEPQLDETTKGKVLEVSRPNPIGFKRYETTEKAN